MRRSPFLLVALVAALLGACSDDGADRPDATATTTTIDPEGLGSLEITAQQLLVTAGEVGIPNLQDAGFTPPAGPDACGFDLDATVAPLVVVGTTLSDGARAVVESIRVYDDEGRGARAYDAAVANACAPVADVNDRVQADAAVQTGTTVVARVRDAVVTVTATGDVPSLLDIAAYATGKILAALGE